MNNLKFDKKHNAYIPVDGKTITPTDIKIIYHQEISVSNDSEARFALTKQLDCKKLRAQFSPQTSSTKLFENKDGEKKSPDDNQNTPKQNP